MRISERKIVNTNAKILDNTKVEVKIYVGYVGWSSDTNLLAQGTWLQINISLVIGIRQFHPISKVFPLGIVVENQVRTDNLIIKRVGGKLLDDLD